MAAVFITIAGCPMNETQGSVPPLSAASPRGFRDSRAQASKGTGSKLLLRRCKALTRKKIAWNLKMTPLQTGKSSFKPPHLDSIWICPNPSHKSLFFSTLLYMSSCLWERTGVALLVIKVNHLNPEQKLVVYSFSLTHQGKFTSHFHSPGGRAGSQKLWREV